MIIPDYCEPIVAYRAWGVNKAGELRAINFGDVWPAGRAARAVCRNGDRLDQFAVGAPKKIAVGHAVRAGLFAWHHDAPHKGCSCGLYAHKESAGSFVKSARTEPDRVWGECHLWGRIIDHEFGYKAEFAYPKSLSTNSPHATAVAERYGVACEYVDPDTIDGYNPSGWIVGSNITVFGNSGMTLPVKFNLQPGAWYLAESKPEPPKRHWFRKLLRSAT